MKKLVATLFSILLYVNSSFALSNNDIPDEFNITQHWISLTSAYDIGTKTEKLGTLYQKFFSLLLTYEFFDPSDNKLATARAKFFSLTAHFDVYDNNESLLGVAEEQFLAFYPTFDIYAKDASTKLANAQMNFWGTTFSIYDPETSQEMATIHRSFFSVKNDWTFTVTNRPLLNKKNIDPRVLLTVIAFQGDREYWETLMVSGKSLKAKDKTSKASSQQINTMLEKINTIYKQEGFTDSVNFDTTLLETIANELENNYINYQTNSSVNQTNQEKVSSFMDYCFTLVQSNGIPNSKKKAILHLLKMRLKEANI